MSKCSVSQKWFFFFGFCGGVFCFEFEMDVSDGNF